MSYYIYVTVSGDSQEIGGSIYYFNAQGRIWARTCITKINYMLEEDVQYSLVAAYPPPQEIFS